MPHAKIRGETDRTRGTTAAISSACLYGLAIVACLAGVVSLSANANTFSRYDAEVVGALAKTSGQLTRDLYQGVKAPVENQVIKACREELFVNVGLLYGTLSSEETLIDLSSRMKDEIDELYVLAAADPINDVSISHANNLRDLANSYLAGCGEDQFTVLKIQSILEIVDRVNTALPAIGRRARAALRAAESPNMR